MRLQEYIKKKGFTYATFGQLIGVTGTTVFRYSSGLSCPTRNNLKKIEDATKGKFTYKDFPQEPKKKVLKTEFEI